MRTIAVIAVASLLVWAAPVDAGKAKTTKLELSVAGMACEGCAGHIVKAVSALSGVKSVKADHEKARVVIVYKPAKVTEAEIRAAITDTGYVIGKEDPPVTYPKGADVKTISKKGEDVRLKKYLASGKITVIDFYADWCKPCKAVDRRLAMLVEKDLQGLAVRKVNIVDWDTPAAKRLLKGVAGLPYVRIYDAKGKFVIALSGDEVDKLERELAKLRKRN